jgi:WD40 repeat protein
MKFRDSGHGAIIVAPVTFVNDAFVSYRRLDGSLFARRLRRRLLDYRFPRPLRDNLPQRRLSIYIDKIYERADEDFFSGQIEPALRDSKHLIIVQTPAALVKRHDGSPNWVEREVAFFRTLPQRDNVSVALARGGVDEPLPAGLHETLPNIERVDIRRLGMFGIGAHDAIVKFVATLHDVPPRLMPELHREEARRRAATAWAIAATSFAALLVVVGLLGLALVSRSAAQRAQREAQRELATSHFRQASVLPEEASPERLAHLARALRADNDHRAARALLIQTLMNRSWPLPLLEWNEGEPVRGVAFSPDETQVMTWTNSTVRFHSARDDRALSQPLSVRQSFIHEVAPSPDWRKVIVVADDGYELFDVVTGSHRNLSSTVKNIISAGWVNGDQITLADVFDGETGEARICDAATGNRCTKPIRGIVQYELCGTRALVNDHERYSVVDVRDGRSIPLKVPNGGVVRQVRFSGDCSRVAAGRKIEGKRFATSETIAVWDAHTGAPLGVFPHSKLIETFQFNGDGTRLASAGSDRHVRVFDLSRGSLTRDITVPSDIHGVRFSADDRSVIVASAAGAEMFDIASGERLGETARHAREVAAVATNRDTSRLLTGGIDGIARLWDIRPGGANPISFDIPVARAVRFSADGKRVAICGSDSMRLYDAASGRPIAPLVAHPAARKAVIDRSLDRVGLVDDAEHVEVRRLSDGRVLAPPVAHGGTVNVLVFDESGDHIATAANDGIRLWLTDGSSGPQWFRGGERDVAWSVAFVPGQQRLVSGWGDGFVRIHDESGIKRFSSGRQKGSVTGVALSPQSGRLLAVSPAPRLWSLTANDAGLLDPIGPELVPHGTLETSVAAISADGLRVAANSGDAVYVWEPSRGLRLTDALPQIGHVAAIAFVPQSNFILVTTSAGARLFDTDSGVVLAQFPATGDPVFDISPDGDRVLLGDDATTRLYDTSSGGADDALRLAELAEAIGGQRVNSGGAIEAVTSRAPVIDRLRRDPATSADAVTRWLVADRAARPPSPRAAGRVRPVP